jgi:hypothetical protein
MKTGAKAILLMAGAATLAVSAPVQARHYDRYNNDRIDAGDIIAGALIIGGIAAIASAASNNDRDYRSRRYDDYSDRRYNDRRDYYGSRQAVDQCVRAAQGEAGRYGRARVTDVTRIDRIGGGYEIRGRLVVEQRGYRGRDYGYNYDRYNDGYDKGRFACVSRYGRVDDVRVSGLDNGYGYDDRRYRY